MGVLDNYTGMYDRITKEAGDARANYFSRKAGNALAGGNPGEAANELYRGGYLNAGAEVQKDAAAVAHTQQQTAHSKRKAEAEGTLAFTQGIEQLVASGKLGDPNDPQTYRKAYDVGVQYAPQLGLDPAHLQQLRPAFSQDPQGFITFARGKAKDTLKVYQHAGHVRGIDTATGEERWAYDMPNDPASQKAPAGFVRDETGNLAIDPGYLAGKAALAKATRAPARGRGRSGAAIPPPPSGWRPR